MKAENIHPWLVNPFQLISWWDMNKFSAEAMVQWTSILKEMGGTLEILKQSDDGALDEFLPTLKGWALEVSEHLKQVGCVLSSSAAARLADL